MSEKLYITTPIYYVNDIPHLGHAYTTIAADVLARHYKKKGSEVFFLTGTDEHGAKIAKAAEKMGKSPKEFVDELSPKFKKTWDKLNIGYNQFLRTTDPKHEEKVLDFINRLKKAGYIEKRKYEGLYCVDCECYYTENQLVAGKCPDHGTLPNKQKEENYFFLLKKAAVDFDLAGKISNDEIRVMPESRKNEILGKIKVGLEDVSISREAVKWGIKFPGDENQTIYVWVDALINYYSATKIFPSLDGWEEHPADLHLMAKDILWFHAIVWPSMLLAVGLPAPKEVFAHGFFTIDGKKMSKTIGNVIDPIALTEKYGTDVVRYALLREFPFGEDGDISEEKIAKRYTNELANGIGNLLQRTLVMINKYGIKPVRSQSKILGDTVIKKIEALEFMEALDCIRQMTDVANEKIEEGRPWELAKEKKQVELTRLLNEVYKILVDIADNLEPFMPETSERILDQLETLKPEPLFPRID